MLQSYTTSTAVYFKKPPDLYIISQNIPKIIQERYSVDDLLELRAALETEIVGFVNCEQKMVNNIVEYKGNDQKSRNK